MKRAAGIGRLVVLASGAGSNMQAIADAIADGSLPAQIVAVVTNRTDAGVVERARSLGIPVEILPTVAGQERSSYDKRLAKLVNGYKPDYIVLAGWMRLLSMTFLKRFQDRVVNLHPALPGQFPGTHAIERALEAAQRLGLNRTGVMVHFVPDEGVDSGPVLATCEVEILPDDSLETLSARMHTAEHTLLVFALAELLSPN